MFLCRRWPTEEHIFSKQVIKICVAKIIFFGFGMIFPVDILVGCSVVVVSLQWKL